MNSIKELMSNLINEDMKEEGMLIIKWFASFIVTLAVYEFLAWWLAVPISVVSGLILFDVTKDIYDKVSGK